MQKATLNNFWSKVIKTNACWLWTAYKNYGYGVLTYHQKQYPAHRFSYELHNGKIPKNKVIDHLCRNRACVNPNHMQLVTRGQNVLLGIGFSAINSRKTKCPRGHLYNYTRKNGSRRCTICDKAFYKNRYKNNKLEINKKRRLKYQQAIQSAEGKE